LRDPRFELVRQEEVASLLLALSCLNGYKWQFDYTQSDCVGFKATTAKGTRDGW